MSEHLVPGDHAFHDDKQLVADLAALNERLSRYVLRYLAADALQAEPISVTEEQCVAEAMTTLASKVQERANRRATSDKPAEFERDAPLRRLPNGGQSER